MSDQPKAGAGEFNCFCGQVHPLSMLGRSGVHPAPVTRPDLDALSPEISPAITVRAEYENTTLARRLIAEKARADALQDHWLIAERDRDKQKARADQAEQQVVVLTEALRNTDHTGACDAWADMNGSDCTCGKSAAPAAEPQ